MAAAAERCKGFFAVNLAPALHAPSILFERADLVIVNEGEAAVYGGAIHPTAEGHAAMADAALPAAMSVLGLGLSEAPVTGEPIAPVRQ